MHCVCIPMYTYVYTYVYNYVYTYVANQVTTVYFNLLQVTTSDYRLNSFLRPII